MHTMLPLGLQFHLSPWCWLASFAFPVSSVSHFPLWGQHLLLPSRLFPFSTFRVTKLLICPGVRGFPSRMWNFQCKIWLPSVIIKWHHYPYIKQRKLGLPGINCPKYFLHYSLPGFTSVLNTCLRALGLGYPTADSQFNSSLLWWISPLFNTFFLRFPHFPLFPLIIQVCVSLSYLQNNICPLSCSPLFFYF